MGSICQEVDVKYRFLFDIGLINVRPILFLDSLGC